MSARKARLLVDEAQLQSLLEIVARHSRPIDRVSNNAFEELVESYVYQLGEVNRLTAALATAEKRQEGAEMTEELEKVIAAHRNGHAIVLPYNTTHEMIRDFVEEIDRLNAEIARFKSLITLTKRASSVLRK